MERLSTWAFSTLLFGISVAMKYTAWRHPAFRARLKEQNLVGQIRVKAGTGRYYVIKDIVMRLAVGFSFETKSDSMTKRRFGCLHNVFFGYVITIIQESEYLCRRHN